ncbi:MAG: acetoacetate decarboxylase family protein [Defluviitaleaceae bacterium]|nr:acetoacetate decarboxylase family protein [Defluviitaleaceae bacterium]
MSGFFIPREELLKKAQPEYNELNDITAATVYAVPDASVAAMIPPPLQLTVPHLLIIYVSRINEPTLAAPYMEGGIGALTTFTDAAGAVHTGLYYFNLQLMGAGAQNAAFFGREEAGLPKKFADYIGLRRVQNDVYFHIERGGVRLLDAHLRIGTYNDPTFSNDLENIDPLRGKLQNDAVLTHRYQTDGENGLHDMNLYYYNSPTFFCAYESAFANVRLASSAADPWGDIKIKKVLGGSYARNNNFIVDVTKIHAYPNADAPGILQYLYPGRFDPMPGRKSAVTPFDCREDMTWTK